MSILGSVCTAACAAALILPSVGSAQQQGNAKRDSITQARSERATSQQRLRVQKEVRGESQGVLSNTAREDSVAAEARRNEEMERARRDAADRAAQATRDSLASAERMRLEAVASEERLRLDAIAAATRDSMARADALAEQERLRRERQRQYRFRGTGFYAGVAAGGVAPTGNLQNLGYNSGFNVNVPLGYHVQNQIFGARVDLGYAQFRGRDFSGKLVGGSTLLLNNSNAKVLSATANITAHLPLTASKNLNVYGVSGVGIYQFRSFGSKSALGGFFGNDVTAATPVAFQSVRNKLGAQFGAGLEYAVGPAAIYVESRVVNVFANRQDNVQLEDFFGANRGSNLRWIPIMIGMNFR